MRIERYNTKNKSRTKLVTNVTARDIYLFVEDASKLPEPPCLLSVDDEIMLMIAKSGNRLQVMRAQEGTKAVNHFVGASVENRITAGTIDKIYTTLNIIKQKLLPGMRKLLIYYAYPRAINGVWDVEQAAMTFARYDDVVLAQNMELPTHDEYPYIKDIISIAKSINPEIMFYGYIRLPLVYAGDSSGYGWQWRVSSWIEHHGVDGIFWGEFGFDYFRALGYDGGQYTDDWKRSKQNEALDFVHGFGKVNVANARNVQDVFSTFNGTVRPPEWWKGLDIYLSESVPCYGSEQEQGVYTDQWSEAGNMWYKNSLLRQEYADYSPKIWWIGTYLPEAHAGEIEPWLRIRYYIGLAMAYGLGTDSFGITKRWYYARSPILLPLYKDKFGTPYSDWKGVYNYWSNQTYTARDNTVYNGCFKYETSGISGKLTAIYANDHRTPLYIRFGDVFEYEISTGYQFLDE